MSPTREEIRAGLVAEAAAMGPDAPADEYEALRQKILAAASTDDPRESVALAELPREAPKRAAFRTWSRVVGCAAAGTPFAPPPAVKSIEQAPPPDTTPAKE